MFTSSVRIALAALVTAGLATVVQAQLVLTTASTAPTNRIAISQTSGGGGTHLQRNSTSDRRAGQTFTWNTRDSLAAITLVANKDSGNGVAFTLRIASFVDNDPAKGFDTILFTGSTNWVQATTGQFWTFDVGSVALQDGGVYGFILNWDGSGGQASAEFRFSPSSQYADGTRLYETKTPGTWLASDVPDADSGDLTFYLQSIPVAPTAILLR